MTDSTELEDLPVAESSSERRSSYDRTYIVRNRIVEIRSPGQECFTAQSPIGTQRHGVNHAHLGICEKRTAPYKKPYIEPARPHMETCHQGE